MIALEGYEGWTGRLGFEGVGSYSEMSVEAGKKRKTRRYQAGTLGF